MVDALGRGPGRGEEEKQRVSEAGGSSLCIHAAPVVVVVGVERRKKRVCEAR